MKTCNYTLGKTLGQGTFGKVKLAIHKPTEQEVAIKIMNKRKMIDVQDIERVQREIYIMKIIRHPNLIQLYEIIETPNHIMLVLEFANYGELYQHILKNQRLTELEACKYFQQIISGVEYLHSLGIAHRDIKPENLLLDYKKNLKFIDFGLSNTYSNNELLKTSCGSPCYAPPEMIEGKRYKGLSGDIWSCGVVLFVMLTGFLPFDDQNTNNLYKKILTANYKVPKYVSAEAQDLLSKILNPDPIKRSTIAEIRSHQWFNMNKVKY